MEDMVKLSGRTLVETSQNELEDYWVKVKKK